MLFRKITFDPKLSWSKNFQSKQIFSSKMLCPKKFGSKRILNPKCFGSKKSRGKKYRSKMIRAHKNCFIKIKLVTAEIFMIWTNVARTNVTWTNVTVTVGIC